MNEFIKQNWFKLAILVILTISVAGIFYWLQIRPEKIRKDCIKKYQYDFDNGNSLLESLNKSGYEQCLRENCLEK